MDNISKISNALKNSDVDGMLVTSVSNRLYATGFEASDGVALILRGGAFFFTDSRYIEAAANAIPAADVLPITRENNYYDRINAVIKNNDIKRLGFEENMITFSEYNTFKEKICAQLVPAEHLLTDLRSVKSGEELEIMIKAQRIAEKSLNEIIPIINTDITEKELAAELLYRMLKNGADDKSFDTIIVSGQKSSMPHGVPEDIKLSKGFLTIDFGVKFKGYCSDMTRTLCIGKPTNEMVKVYNSVLEAQLAGIAAARGGVMGCDIDTAARNVIEKAGYGQYFGHSFGHGLGLDIHEAPNASPSNKNLIPAGAVISAEPGIYLPGKFGVRIEDVLFITENGCNDITLTQKDLIIL